MANNKLTLKNRLKYFGEAPLCNLRKERAPIINGKCFVLCWRCTMVIVGMILSVLSLKGKLYFDYGCLIIAILLMIPMLIDGFRQRYSKYVSTNFKRAVTGFLFGISMGMVCIWISDWLRLYFSIYK